MRRLAHLVWVLLISLVTTIAPHHRPRPKPRTVLTTPATTAPRHYPALPIERTSAVSGTVVDSTAYCQAGTMSNGQQTAPGDVAADAWPLGTRLAVSDSPDGPETVTVTDRIGWGSQLDFFVGNCSAALQWGRRNVSVRAFG